MCPLSFIADFIVVYFIKKVVKEMEDDLADDIEYYFLGPLFNRPRIC